MDTEATFFVRIFTHTLLDMWGPEGNNQASMYLCIWSVWRAYIRDIRHEKATSKGKRRAKAKWQHHTTAKCLKRWSNDPLRPLHPFSHPMVNARPHAIIPDLMAVRVRYFEMSIFNGVPMIIIILFHHNVYNIYI